jgi:hypothetical protein
MSEQTQSALDQAIACLLTGDSAPGSDSLVTELVALEKRVRRLKERYGYEQLLGTWRLGWVTGTVKTRQQAGTVLGAGRFVPGFLKIQLAYQATDLAAGQGTVQNSVSLGPLRLELTGPTQFWPQTNSLAFDFTRLQIRVGNVTLYGGSVRGGAKREAEFHTQTLKDQAFFSYFYVDTAALAARGRGGGLALWVKSSA